MSGYRAEYDPILHATNVVCSGCQSVAYPVDAEWITDRLILASYEDVCRPGCPGRRQGGDTILVDLDAESAAIPKLPGPRRCKGTTVRTGQPCKSYAVKGSAYCVQHDPVRQARP